MGGPPDGQRNASAQTVRSPSPNRGLFPEGRRLPRTLTHHTSPFSAYQMQLDESVIGMPYLTEELFPLFNKTPACSALPRWDRLRSLESQVMPTLDREFGLQKAIVLELGLASRSLITMARALGLYLQPRERIDLWDWRVFEVLATLESSSQSQAQSNGPGRPEHSDARMHRIANIAASLKPHYFGFVAAVPEAYLGAAAIWTSRVDPVVARSKGAARSEWSINGNLYFCPRGEFEEAEGLMVWRDMAWEVARDWVESETVSAGV